jgi:hypothetical protein
MNFSDQSHQDGESSVHKRFNLVNDFVEAINQHRDSYFTPSGVICVDDRFLDGMDRADIGLRTDCNTMLQSTGNPQMGATLKILSVDAATSCSAFSSLLLRMMRCVAQPERSTISPGGLPDTFDFP